MNNTPVTRLLSYKYTPATANASAPAGGPSGVLLLRLAGLARFTSSGVWGLQLSGAMAPASVRIMVGQVCAGWALLGACAHRPTGLHISLHCGLGVARIAVSQALLRQNRMPLPLLLRSGCST